MTPREFQDRLKRRARRTGLSISPELSQALERFYVLLSRWNQKINLTALPLQGAPDETLDRLILEPLVAVRHLKMPNATIIDVGSGGGSPAIPMKLSVPASSLTMVESKTRKSAFLREAIRQLELKNVAVETARFEELLSRPELHEAADLVTLRAVRVEARALMTLQAFLKPGGEIFLFRGSSGRDVPDSLPPPLEWRATHSLVDSLGSRLVVIGKTQVRRR